MATHSASQISIQVDGGERYQTMAGFGSSVRLFEDPLSWLVVLTMRDEVA